MQILVNEVKEQKGGLLSMLLGKLGASLLGNNLADWGAISMSHGRGINRAGEGVVRAGYGHHSLKFSKKSQKPMK